MLEVYVRTPHPRLHDIYAAASEESLDLGIGGGGGVERGGETRERGRR